MDSQVPKAGPGASSFIDGNLRHPPPNIPNCGTCERSVNAKMRAFLVKTASFGAKKRAKNGVFRGLPPLRQRQERRWDVAPGQPVRLEAIALRLKVSIVYKVITLLITGD